MAAHAGPAVWHGKSALRRPPVAEVERLLRSGKAEARLVFRASIIWRLSVLGQHPQQVAAILHTSPQTVRKWRRRFAVGGSAALSDLPRSGAPAKFSTAQRCEVIAIACDRPAHCGVADAQVWTLNLLVQAVAHEAGFTISRSSIQRTLTRNALRPHRVEMWLHSRDADFRAKANRIVELYRDPPEDAVVLCVDEKTGIQATERRHPFTPARPGCCGRFEFEYVRHGTASLLAAFNIRSGQVTSALGPTRKGVDLTAFMAQVAVAYPKAKRIVVIWDNLNIHHDGADRRWTTFNRLHGNKFEFVYTPIHASWLNQAEIFFSILARRCLRYGSFTSTAELESVISRFIACWNHGQGHPLNWSFRGYPMQEVAA